ncbi:helix-turn-helix domain-containing protein, partial [candidate division WOR-3 bacterium]|nr:helix-turn-helix domain-containing protein [candidate division WOR-3 bacterium]
MNKDIETKIKAVEKYSKDGSLRKTALKFNIPHNTLWAWVKKYRQGTRSFYVKPWNRPSKEIEEKIMLLKENDPSLTIKETKKILNKQDISLSVKGVYDIWKRYNLVRRSVEHPFSPLSPSTAETKCAIEYIRSLFRSKKNNNTLREAALIVNNLPSYPTGNEDILQEIPERFLSARRKLDLLYINFLEIPMPEYYKKIISVRKTLEKNGYLYSSIIAGLLESLALHWMQTPEEGLKLHSILRKRKGNLRDPVINFELALSSAMAYAELLQAEKSYEYARRCKRLLRSLPYSSFLVHYGDFMTSIFNYKEAGRFYQMTIESSPEKKTLMLSLKMTLCYIMAGEYSRAAKISKRVKIHPQKNHYANYAINQA